MTCLKRFTSSAGTSGLGNETGLKSSKVSNDGPKHCWLSFSHMGYVDNKKPGPSNNLIFLSIYWKMSPCTNRGHQLHQREYVISN